jgi:Flp pilus assembly protein TadB
MRCRWDPIYPEYSRRGVPTHDTNIRASDAERTEVADRLSHHFAEGRLDQTEFKARLDRAMGATTRGDLGGLFDDLPSIPAEAPPLRRRRRLVPALVFLILVAVIVGSTVPMIRVPWVLLVVVALLLWRRLGWRHARYAPLPGEHYHHGGPES